jgi:phage terminase large subunit
LGEGAADIMMWTIADSAEPKSIDEFRSFGMKIKGAKKGPGSVEFGIKFYRTWRQIIIDPERCPLAAREFINYALETDRNGIVKSQFPDKDDHAIDCCRYALSEDMVHTIRKANRQTTRLVRMVIYMLTSLNFS